jgi:hypothetical protein
VRATVPGAGRWFLRHIIQVFLPKARTIMVDDSLWSLRLALCTSSPLSIIPTSSLRYMNYPQLTPLISWFGYT